MGTSVQGTVASGNRPILENIALKIVEAAEGTIADIVSCTVTSTTCHWAGSERYLRRLFPQSAGVCQRARGVPVKEMHYGAHVEIQQRVAVLKVL